MIVYDNKSWMSLIFRWEGNIWGTIWKQVVAIFVISWAVYYLEVEAQIELGNEGHTIFGSTMSYLLVFRANNASERYWDGRCYLTHIFHKMREIVFLMAAATQGGAAGKAWRTRRAPRQEREQLMDQNDIRASALRANFVRWVIGFMVSLKLHSRICHHGFITGVVEPAQKRMVDMDRIRLRGLMTRHEFEELNDMVPIHNEEHVTGGQVVLKPEFIEERLQAPSSPKKWGIDTEPNIRQPLAILYKLRLETMRHINEPWGFKERFAKDFLAFCADATMLYEDIVMIINTPIPFPYVHLCKVLLSSFLFSIPLVIKPELGFVANVMFPTMAAMSLLGIDSIASELENPFGEEINDLDMTIYIGMIEDECMKLLELCGDFNAREAFGHYPFPAELQSSDNSAPLNWVCMRSQVELDGPAETVFSDEDSPISPASPTRASPTKAPPAKARSPKEKRASFADEDDEGRPLLGGMGSHARSSEYGFVPMRELDDGDDEAMINLEGEIGVRGGRGDAIGLSEGEDEEEEEEQQEPAHVTVDPATTSSAGARRERPGSARGFRPMEEFGTQTIVFEDKANVIFAGNDVVGLSDDEEEEEEDEDAEDEETPRRRDEDLGGGVRGSFAEDEEGDEERMQMQRVQFSGSARLN